MAVLHFQQSGSGANILLIHGLFGSLENLNMVAKGLSDSYCVTNVDVRNHGGSFHENTMDYPSLAQDIIDTLDHLNINSTAILGHSMGGKIAMQVALDFPQRIEKLIVADISPIAYPPHHNQIIAGLLSIDIANINSRKMADQQLANYVEDSGVRQFLLRNIAKNSDGSGLKFKCNLPFIAHCYPQIVKGYQGDKKFNKATLFIKGGNSDYITNEHQARILQLFPQSKAKVIQGAGHWLHAEKTVAFNKIVKDFLQ
ncbi:acyl-CoA esterase [Thalassotalea insulae]|uniref:Acyl-CoA esterase n=1 Tax=Thalassotalea insulae TaxID=2056778 RepID=A0ABQ6GZ48_9GAMM|nr:alpha/beta fold hydrolase [Thalassotalea insulae]GLX80015.1 acyl-CoA esterase [Thalassotalea insulae]